MAANSRSISSSTKKTKAAAIAIVGLLCMISFLLDSISIGVSQQPIDVHKVIFKYNNTKVKIAVYV